MNNAEYFNNKWASVFSLITPPPICYHKYDPLLYDLGEWITMVDDDCENVPVALCEEARDELTDTGDADGVGGQKHNKEQEQNAAAEPQRKQRTRQWACEIAIRKDGGLSDACLSHT